MEFASYSVDYCNSVLCSLPWSRLQLLNSVAHLIRGLKRFDLITYHLS